LPLVLFKTFVTFILHVESSPHSWYETNLIMVYDLSNALLNLLCKYFIENFYMYVHQKSWCIIFFFFFLCICLVWVLGWYCLHRMSLAVSLPFLFYGEVWGVLVFVFFF
jgi:hypothetical protein